jgi:phenylacetate-CoA ligase
MDRVKITVEPESAIPKDSYIVPRERLQKELKGALGIDVQVELVPYGSLPRTSFKSKRIIDMRESPFPGDRSAKKDEEGQND